MVENPNKILFKEIAEYISKQDDLKSVLDVGCGKGDLLNYLHSSDSSLELTGLDLSENSNYSDIKFIQEDLFKYESNLTYDVVISLATIEHVWDVKKFLKRLDSLCRPGGYLIIMTLDEYTPIYMLSRWLYKLGISFPVKRLYDKHHLNHFNKDSLSRLILDQGFEVVSHTGNNPPMAALDLPVNRSFFRFVFLMAFKVLFSVGNIIEHPFLQTIYVRKIK